MQNHGDKDELIDHIYAVAIEPERFRELIDVWEKNLNATGEQTNYNFSDELKLVNRHLDRAGNILTMVEANEKNLPQPLIEKLNAEPHAMIAFADDGKIESANRPAQSLFGIKDECHIDDLPFNRESSANLQSISRRLFDQMGRELNPPPDICRIGMSQSDASFLVTFSTWQTAGSRRLVLMKSADFVWPDHLSPLVQNAFEMTEAEIDVMRMMVEGNRLQEVAEKRGSSIATVRTQVRSIYAKTSTRNQSEFMRMAIGLTTMELTEKSSVTGAFHIPAEAIEHCFPLPDHRQMLTLRDGRQLDYAVFGPEDGTPCLHFHNEFYGDIWPARLASLALQNRLRVIIPARAYYGQTSPYPSEAVSYNQTSDDIEFLLDHLGVGKTLAISQVWGLRFALHFASTRPDRVAAMVSFAPSLPFSAEDDRRKMPKIARFVANTIRHRSNMLEFVAKSGFIFHSRVGSQKFLQTLLSQSQPDTKVIQDPNNLAAIVQGFKFSSNHEHRAYFNDYRQVLAHDRQMLIDLKCRTYAVIGTEDNNSRFERAQKLIDEGSNLEIVSADNGGEMLFYSHPELVLETIQRSWIKAMAN